MMPAISYSTRHGKNSAFWILESELVLLNVSPDLCDELTRHDEQRSAIDRH